MKINKMLLSMLAIFLVVFLSACSMGNSPGKTVDSFMTAVKNYELEEAVKHTSKDVIGLDNVNQQNKDLLDEDLKSYENYARFEENIKSLSKELKYKTISEEVDGDNAVIKLEISYADASESMLEALQELFKEAFGALFGQEISEEEMQNKTLGIMADKLEEVDHEIVTVEGEFKLAKENDEWKIKEATEEVVSALTFGLNGFNDQLELE